MRKTLQLDPKDNVIVALQDLAQNDTITDESNTYKLIDNIPAKHKFFATDLSAGNHIIMYGNVVGTTQVDVKKGQIMTTSNAKHATSGYAYNGYKHTWVAPQIDQFKNRTFKGYKREDGRVGTANYWLFIPTVFCENRNLDIIKEALVEQLGYGLTNNYKEYVNDLMEAYNNKDSLANISLGTPGNKTNKRLFKNVDGIKFLTHQGGCGGTREDAVILGKLLASYIDHPNVAGATILGLGCENLQLQALEEELHKRCPNSSKPILKFEQQQVGTESALIQQAIHKTFEALITANNSERTEAPLSKLVLGVKCGGSDGFSGISANPAIGYAADLLVSLQGSVLLAEFPELCGTEQELLNRMKKAEHAEKFISLMESYGQAAENVGSGFHMNPSPGNIRDGLITDAMKSNGAAKKGGNSPIVDVLDYTEPIRNTGLNLVCTPGNDVEATTGKAASGATLILFTTGLGTPTGNPICPTIKVATNNALQQKMPDIIDINTGDIITGKKTIAEMGTEILELCIKVASGEVTPKAVALQQDDFIPWKRGISL